MKPRIVITGVAGFIGSNLADLLIKKNYNVIGIDNLEYGLIEQVPQKVEFHNKDIRAKDFDGFISEDDIIFHLAAKNCVIDCENDPLETISNNIYGSMNVYQSAIKKKAKKFIYADTSAVYENTKNFPSGEEDIDPKSCYANSKFMSSQFFNMFNDNKIKLTGLRYFNVYGPRQDYRRSIPPVMSAFIIKLLKNERPTIFGKTEKRRDFIHVKDINNFHLMCIEDERTDNNVFNLGTGKDYSIVEIFKIIKELLSSKLEPIYKPEFTFEAKRTLANIERAKMLGWKPQIDIKNGLLDMINYIKSINFDG